MTNSMLAELGDSNAIKTGIVKKRSGRMHQWTSRFFVLSDSKISYKLKADAPQFKCSYDLSPGCIVTEVNVESRIQGKKLYSFWIVWPHDKTTDGKDGGGDDSDEEKETVNDFPVDESTHNIPSNGSSNKPKDLKQIVESEVMTMKRQRTLVEQQVELHTAADNSVSLGAKVAAVAVGGVVVGALTAGIGLIPYLTVVGITAAAGGSAVAWQWRYRKPLDSRLIMACESMQEAIDWKTAIEGQIQRIEGTIKPSLPSVNCKVIASMLDRETLGGTWRRVGVCEQMTIYEHMLPTKAFLPACPVIGLGADCEDAIVGVWTDATSQNDRDINEDVPVSMRMTRCRRAQLVIPCQPINAFLCLMNAGLFPQHGTLKSVKQLDDHADVVGIELETPCALYRGSGSVRRRLALSRFWSLDDEGVYLITLNSIQCDEFPCEIQKHCSSRFSPVPFEQSPTIAAVLSISPRSDCSHLSQTHNALSDEECLCVVHCQASCAHWEKGEQTGFLMAFLKDHLLELQHSVSVNKYFTVTGNELHQELCKTSANPVSTTSAVTTLSERDGAKISVRAESPVPARRTKRGVTTIQPGMEETHSTQSSSHMTAQSTDADTFKESDKELDPPAMLDKSPTLSVNGKTKSSRLGLFGRKKSTILEEKDKSEKQTLSSPAKSIAHSTAPTPAVSQRDSAKLQREAQIHLVRQQIGATEYELHRLAKTMKKKIIVSPSYATHSHSRVEKHHVTPTEYSAIQDAQSELQRKLQQLRQRHVTLTGETYEQFKAAHRQSLSRYLSGPGKRDHATGAQVVETIAQDAVSEEVKKEHELAARGRPAHWVRLSRSGPQKSWIIVLPSLLVSLLQPSFWQRVWSSLALEDFEDEENILNFCARDSLSRESALVILALFAALLISAHVFADALSGCFTILKLTMGIQ